MIDSYLLLTPILALPLVALLIFVGCDFVVAIRGFPNPGVPVLSALPGDNRVDLSWTESGRAAKFTVKRKDSGGLSFNIVSDAPEGATGYSDATVINGQTYTYVVTATGDDGETDPSNKVMVTPFSSTLTAFVQNPDPSQLSAAQVSPPPNLFGIWFTVGSNDLIIKTLGRAFVPGNSQIHLVKIVDTAGVDVPNGFAAVSMAGGTTPGEFRYAAVGGVVTLSANTSYFLLSEEKMPGDQIYNRTIPLTTTDVAVLEGAVRGTAVPFEQFAGDAAYGPLNFQY